MAVRLKSLYYSSEDIPYGIELYDTDLGADADIDFDMPVSGAPALSYEGNEDDVFSEILACSASVTMWIENADQRSFFNDFVLAPEGRFFMRLYYMDGVTEVTYFIGKVIHDTTYLETGTLPTFTINAIDAMMELKTIDYEPTTNLPSSYITIMLEYCLMTSSITTFFFDNDTDGVFHVYNEYESVLHLDSTEVLSDTYLENYFSTAVDGQEEKYTCLSVLAELLRGLGARMYFDKGRYVMEQIRSRDTAAAQYTIYNRLGTKLGVGTEDFDIVLPSNLAPFVQANTLYTFSSPVRAAILSQDGDFIDNLLFSLKYADYYANNDVTVGNVAILDDDLKVYCRLRLSPYVLKTSDFLIGWPKHGFIQMDLKIQVGTKYLSGTATIAQSNSNQEFNISVEDAIWTDVSTNRVVIIVPSYVKFDNLQENANDNTFTIDITSPIIEATGDIVYGLDSSGVFSTPAVDTALSFPGDDVYSSKWESLSSGLSVLQGLADGNTTKGTTITTLINDLDNTVVYRTNYNMGDFPGTTSKHRLRVNDDKADSTEWTHPDFGNMPFQQLALHDILAVRRTARRKMQATISLKGILPVTPRNRITYDSKTYLPLNCKMLTGADVLVGQFFQISLGKGAMNSPNIVDPHIEDWSGNLKDNTQGGGTTSLLGNTPVAAGGYYKLVQSATGDNVDVSDYVGLPDPDTITGDSIRKSLKVYIGGTKQRFNNVAKSLLIVGEFRINLGSELLEWGRDNTGKVIEIDSSENYIAITPTV